MDGQVTSLSQADRAVVARWFAKTVLTAQLAETPRNEPGLLPDSVFVMFHRDRTAPMNQRTWLAVYEGPKVPLTVQLSGPAPPGHGLLGYMSFGSVVIFSGWFFGEPGRMNILVPPWFPLAVRLIWPPGDEVAAGPMPWPPSEAISGDAIEGVREMVTRL